MGNFKGYEVDSKGIIKGTLKTNGDYIRIGTHNDGESLVNTVSIRRDDVLYEYFTDTLDGNTIRGLRVTEYDWFTNKAKQTKRYYDGLGLPKQYEKLYLRLLAFYVHVFEKDQGIRNLDNYFNGR